MATHALTNAPEDPVYLVVEREGGRHHLASQAAICSNRPQNPNHLP